MDGFEFVDPGLIDHRALAEDRRRAIGRRQTTLEERGMRGQGSERTFPMLLQLDDRRGVEH